MNRIKGMVLVMFAVMAMGVTANAEDWETMVIPRITQEDIDAGIKAGNQAYTNLNPNWLKIYDELPAEYFEEVHDGIIYNRANIWGYKYLDHYKIQFDANGGTNYAVDYATVTQYCTYGWLPEEIIEMENGEGAWTGKDNDDSKSEKHFVLGVVRTGYHLAGWSLDKEGKQRVFVDDIVPSEWEHGKTYTLYAQWIECNDARHNWDAIIAGKATVEEVVKKTEEQYKQEVAAAESKTVTVTNDNTSTTKDTVTISVDDTANTTYRATVSDDNFETTMGTYDSRDGKVIVTGLEEGSTYYIRITPYTTVEDVNGNIQVIKGKESSVVAVTTGDKGKDDPVQTVEEGEIIVKDSTELKAAEKTIKKAKTSIKSVTNKKGRKMVITVAKKKGYKTQIVIATDSKFKKNKKTYTITGTSKTTGKLKKGKTYRVKARVFKKVRYKEKGKTKTKKVYGKWTKTVKCKIKK